MGILQLLRRKRGEHMLLDVLKIRNGDSFQNYEIYKCDHCEKIIEESFPHYSLDNFHLCWDCAFIENKITEKEYIECSGVSLPNAHAVVKDGKVVLWVGKKTPWERKNKDHRQTKQYQDWRIKVFERDKYTCQKCEQVGGELNAHHIKLFSTYEDLRYELSNGQTLCVLCHKEVHRKKVI
jgi:5-methylcytosine-specific restriction endonuclease McrA